MDDTMHQYLTLMRKIPHCMMELTTRDFELMIDNVIKFSVLSQVNLTTNSLHTLVDITFIMM